MYRTVEYINICMCTVKYINICVLWQRLHVNDAKILNSGSGYMRVPGWILPILRLRFYNALPGEYCLTPAQVIWGYRVNIASFGSGYRRLPGEILPILRLRLYEATGVNIAYSGSGYRRLPGWILPILRLRLYEATGVNIALLYPGSDFSWFGVRVFFLTPEAPCHASILSAIKNFNDSH